jgi:hypothetical protein
LNNSYTWQIDKVQTPNTIDVQILDRSFKNGKTFESLLKELEENGYEFSKEGGTNTQKTIKFEYNKKKSMADGGEVKLKETYKYIADESLFAPLRNGRNTTSLKKGDVVKVTKIGADGKEDAIVANFEGDAILLSKEKLQDSNKFEKTMASGGMTAGRYYKDNSGKEFRYIGESEGKLLFKDGEKIVTKSEEDFEDAPKEKKLFGIFADGGKIVGYEVEYEKLVGGERERDIKIFKTKEKYTNQVYYL